MASFEALFDLVCDEDTGEADVELVVDVFSHFGVPRQVLSAVWRAADTGGTNDLSQGRVERALKLLRLYQDTGDVDLNAADDIDAMDGLDPPVFEEGYDPWEDSASSVGDEDGVATGPHADAYEELYASILNDNGEPDVLLVKDLLQRTGMERMALREIWSTSDIDGSDALSRGRVFRALRLISLAQNSKPTTLSYLDVVDESQIEPPVFPEDESSSEEPPSDEGETAEEVEARIRAEMEARMAAEMAEREEELRRQLEGDSGKSKKKSKAKAKSKGKAKASVASASGSLGSASSSAAAPSVSSASAEPSVSDGGSSSGSGSASSSGSDGKRRKKKKAKSKAKAKAKTKAKSKGKAKSKSKSKAKAKGKSKRKGKRRGSSSLSSTATSGSGGGGGGGSSSSSSEQQRARNYEEGYEMLFQKYMKHYNNEINQTTVAELLQATGVDRTVLKHVWGAASCSDFDKASVIRALRLVALAQLDKPYTLEYLMSKGEANVALPSFVTKIGGGSSSKGKGKGKKGKGRASTSSGGGGGGGGSSSVAVDDDHNVEPLIPARDTKISIANLAAGTIIKHTNYTLFTASYNAAVERRFKDFVWFYEELVKIYPYRIVPSLPAKKAVGKADQRLAEHRCRRLQIFLDMLLERPVFQRNEDLIKLFFLQADRKVFERAKKTFTVTEQEFDMYAGAKNVERLIRPNSAEFLSVLETQLGQTEEYVRNMLKVTTEIATHHEILAGSFRQLGSLVDTRFAGTHTRCWENCGACERLANQARFAGHNAAKHGQCVMDLHVAEITGVVNVLWEFYLYVRGLRVAYEQASIPVRQQKAREARLQQNKAKLLNAQARLGAGAKENNLRNSITRDNVDIVNEGLRCAFATFCLQNEIAFYHEQRKRVSNMWSSSILAMYREFSVAATAIWET